MSAPGSAEFRDPSCSPTQRRVCCVPNILGLFAFPEDSRSQQQKAKSLFNRAGAWIHRHSSWRPTLLERGSGIEHVACHVCSSSRPEAFFETVFCKRRVSQFRLRTIYKALDQTSLRFDRGATNASHLWGRWKDQGLHQR